MVVACGERLTLTHCDTLRERDPEALVLGQREALCDSERVTVPLRLREGEGEEEGQREADAAALALREPETHWLTLRERLPEALVLGQREAPCDGDLLTVPLRLREGEGESVGQVEADAGATVPLRVPETHWLTLRERLPEALVLGQREAPCDGDLLTVPLRLREGEGEVEALREADATDAVRVPEAQREVLRVCEGLIEREAAPEGKEADADCDRERVREGVTEVQGEPEKEPAGEADCASAGAGSSASSANAAAGSAAAARALPPPLPGRCASALQGSSSETRAAAAPRAPRLPLSGGARGQGGAGAGSKGGTEAARGAGAAAAAACAAPEKRAR